MAKGYPTKNAVMFLGEDGEFENAAEWQKLMSWPRLPTYEEALAYSRHDEASVAAIAHYAVLDFRKNPPPPVVYVPRAGGIDWLPDPNKPVVWTVGTKA